MTAYELGQIRIGGLSLKLVMEDGKLRQIMFEAGSERSEAPGQEMKAALKQLREYLAGTRKIFTLKLDPVGSEFQKKVWNAMREIPYGETRSYGQIARQIGSPKASRAVGQAANRNPLPIVIPCHRLIGSNGSLTGYAGGLETKQMLLELEKKASE